MSVIEEEDGHERSIVRTARSLSQGNVTNAASSPSIAQPVAQASAVVGEDGKVRRRWYAGDPWTDDYYFGEGVIPTL